MILIDIKDIIAAYAAFVSTLVLIWNIYNSLRDKGKIKVSGFYGLLLDDYKQTQKILYYEFTNVGRKPIHLDRVATDLKREVEGAGHYIIVVPGLPKKLEPGERHQVVLHTFDSVDENTKSLYVIDSIGKKHKMKKKELKKLIRQKELSQK
ncbi:hypothetical protein NYE69_06895 [Paenibacillus sp. FSL R5-0527]|uniref:hypothetical protein n=1 Tax=Paenibacillus sp. FSL R5-0527 TaxID=2975321 RepID=UPI00097B28E2|nr:hypothetical protein BK140_09295 [Paenibacillus macerans]